MQSSTGLTLLDVNKSKWNSSAVPEKPEGLTLDKIKKSANLISAAGGVIKNKESLKVIQQQRHSQQSSTTSVFPNRNAGSPSKNTKYARQQPFLSLSSLNARKKSMESGGEHGGSGSQYPYTENPVMGVAG